VGNVPAIPAVADCGLLNYPPLQNFMRSRNAKPALHPHHEVAAKLIGRYSMLAAVILY